MESQLAYWLIGLSRTKKACILISADVFFSVFALWVAFSLRWGYFYVPKNNEWLLFVAAPFIAVPVFIRLGLYRAIIRYIEIRALWTIVQATVIYSLIFAVVIFESSILGIPRTVPPLNWLLMLLLVGSSRFFARWWLRDIYFQVTGKRSITNGYKKKCHYLWCG